MDEFNNEQSRIFTTWSRSINRLKEFWNLHRKEVVLGLIIFLVASLSFGLGYLANREFIHAPIIIEKNNGDANF